MSYILDALRRADAERERGAVPGLHAQPLPSLAADPGDRRRTTLWIAAGAGALLLAVAAVAGYLLAGPRQSPAMAVAAPDGTVVATASAPPASIQLPPVAVATPAPARPSAMDETTKANATKPARIATREIAEPMPRKDAARSQEPARAAPTPAVEKPPARTRREPPSSQADVTASANPAPAASASDRRIYGLDELPAEIRRTLPQVVVSGSIYSDDATSRFVMINGEVVREGGKVTPELTLELIQLKSAILRYKGYRYRVAL